MKQEDDSKTIYIGPTPFWSAWLYASVRAHPGWRLSFGKGGGMVDKVDPRAPDLAPLMAAWADSHPDEIARFRELPESWETLTEEHNAVIVGSDGRRAA
jgi:hypothetical protein